MNQRTTLTSQDFRPNRIGNCAPGDKGSAPQGIGGDQLKNSTPSKDLKERF